MQEHVISKEEDFLKTIDLLSKEQSIAVDLEFDKNRYRYGFTMCLMQVATQDECFVIDPLSESIDISLIFPVMEDSAIIKLAFEFGEDIRLFHHLGCRPKNLYDLSISTKLLDYSQVSVGNILSQLLAIEVDKSSQKSNWFQMPLSEKQVKYAADDVRYLHRLESILNKRIEEKKIDDWIKEERFVFENQNFESTENSNHYKIRDMDDMSEVQWYIFECLIEFREELAKDSNRPSYQIMDKDFLLRLAKNNNMIDSFYMESKASKRFLNETFKMRLLNLVKSSKQIAIEKGFSLTDLVNPKLSQEEMDEVRAKKNIKDSIVSNTYKPIQKLIKQDFGENAAVYIMGNRLMNELAAGSYDNLRDYKRELIVSYAKQLNMNLPFS